MHELCRRFSVPTVVVTLGKRGCFVSTETEYRQLPSLDVEKAVDTTGAGDAFVGGFAAGFVRYCGDLFKAAEFGNIVAGISVTRQGASLVMPTLAEIEPYFKAQGLD